MIRRLPLLAAAAALAVDCSVMRPVAHLGEVEDREFTIECERDAGASVRVAFWNGRLRVRPGDSARAIVLHARDNIVELEPRSSARRDGDHLDVRLWLDSDENLLDMKAWNEDDNERDPSRDAQNEWDLELPTSLPTELDLDLATCDADIDIGGIPLRDFRLDLGGGRAKVAFGRPNPLDMERLELDVGAGGLETRRLGNAHARVIAVDAGAGACALDLSGEWKEDALVHVDAGACGIEIRVPRDLSVKADLRECVLAEISAPDFDSAGPKCFTSPAWKKGGPTIVVEVDASIGSVRLILE